MPKKSEPKWCPGPQESRGATQDSELGVKAGPTPDKEGEWLNMKHRPLTFCEHGYQYSHYIKE